MKLLRTDRQGSDVGTCHYFRQVAGPCSVARGEVCRARRHLFLLFLLLQRCVFRVHLPDDSTNSAVVRIDVMLL